MRKQVYGFIFLFLVVFIGLLIAYIQEKNLEKNFIIVEGNIIGLETTVQNPEVFVRFKFTEINNNHTGMSSVFESHKTHDYKFLDSLLKNQSLPVVYQKNNLGNNKMLFSKKECEKYKVQLSPQEERIINTIDSLVKSER